MIFVRSNMSDAGQATRLVKKCLRLNLCIQKFALGVLICAEEAAMVFDEDELRRLGKAFDRAWDRFLLAGMLTPDNLSRSRELIAKRILDTGWRGEHDEWRLARDALFNAWQLQFTGTPPLPVVGGTIKRRFKKPTTAETSSLINYPRSS